MHDDDILDAIDTFFFMTAFLLTISLLPRLIALKQEGKRIYSFIVDGWPWMVVHRWIRLTPTLAAAMGLAIVLGTRLVKGPYNYAVQEELQRCQAHWWYNFLYVSNYLGINNENGACFALR